jgi:oligosaccharide repeat unit polymerase
LGKLEANPDASLIENAGPVTQGLVMYAAGGPVAFDQILRHPGIEARFFQVGAVYIPILNKLGAHIDEPNPDAGPGFLELGPHHLTTNIYSIYGEYLDLGYPGMMAMMVLLGAIVTGFYKRALRGNRISEIMYAWLFSGLMLSSFAELFFSDLYYVSKFCALLWLVYVFPRVLSSIGRLLGIRVERDLLAL